VKIRLVMHSYPGIKRHVPHSTAHRVVVEALLF